jgi:tRNA threonylcarbamoyladenosine biosynthesis protein TsaB
LLAFDTSTEWCSCALVDQDKVVFREQKAGQSHSEIVLPMIDSLLAEAELSLNKLDAIAYGCGPGSFTGLRIACGVAQGLAFGAGLPVIGVDSLIALAEQTGSFKVVACIDARMGEIYHAVYARQDDDWSPVSQPRLCKPSESPTVEGDGWTGAGSGYAPHGEALARRYGKQLVIVHPNMLPRALEMAHIAVKRFARGEVEEAENAAPLYIRDKVALKSSER